VIKEEFKLTLVGDGEMRQEVECEISKQKLEDKIVITGWCSAEEVKNHLDQAKALILPSLMEGIPVVIMEAMARHTPVISTYVSGIPELVQNGVNGWLVPPSDVDSLANAILECIDTGIEELRGLGEEGFASVKRSHNISVEVAKLKDSMLEEHL